MKLPYFVYCETQEGNGSEESSIAGLDHRTTHCAWKTTRRLSSC